MTLTDKWKKGELPRGYYYAEDNGEELIIHIQEKNGSVMGDDFNLEATDWIKPIAPVPSYEEWQEEQKSLKVLAEVYCKEKEENQQLKELLSKCREKLDELDYGCEVWQGELTGFIEEIDNAVGEKK